MENAVNARYGVCILPGCPATESHRAAIRRDLRAAYRNVTAVMFHPMSESDHTASLPDDIRTQRLAAHILRAKRRVSCTLVAVVSLTSQVDTLPVAKELAAESLLIEHHYVVTPGATSLGKLLPTGELLPLE